MGRGEKWGGEKRERESDSRWRRFEISDRVRCLDEREREPEERRWHIVGRRKEPVAGRDVLVGEHSVHHIATTPIDCSDCLHSIDKAPATSQTEERRAFHKYLPRVVPKVVCLFGAFLCFHFDRQESVPKDGHLSPFSERCDRLIIFKTTLIAVSYDTIRKRYIDYILHVFNSLVVNENRYVYMHTRLISHLSITHPKSIRISRRSNARLSIETA